MNAAQKPKKVIDMRVLSTILMTCFAAPAFALSCMPYNATQAFIDAQAAPEPYLVVVGTLEFDDENLPKVDWEHQENVKPDNLFRARVEGHSLAKRGFVLPFREEISVNVQCYGPWCSSLTNGETYLAFIQQTKDGYLLETNPCGGFAFGDPSGEMLYQMKSCMRGTGCDPELPEQ